MRELIPRLGLIPWCLLFATANVSAEVTLDGSLTDSVGREVTAVFDPSNGLQDFRIEPDMGRLQGTNLFHSFGRFSLSRTESATFRGPPSVPIDNVIARVTGGAGSNIDGQLRSAIPGAGLYLIDPAGIFFGPNATLELAGAFHASTAGYLGMQDGTRFNAAASAADAALTSAPPAAFGFVGHGLAGIRVTGGVLGVSPGETASLIAGAVLIEGGSVLAPQGRVDMAAIAGRGEVRPTAAGLEVSPELSQGSIAIQGAGRVVTTGNGGGAVFIRGGQLLVQGGSVIESGTLGDGPGGIIHSTLEGSVVVDNAIVATGTFGIGEGGEVRIEADEVQIRNGGLIDSSTFATGTAGSVSIDAAVARLDGGKIAAESAANGASGPAGQIRIEAERVRVRNGSEISGSSFLDGTGGSVHVWASESIEIGGRHSDINPNGIFNVTNGIGAGGDVVVKSEGVLTMDDGRILTRTRGAANGGNLTVEAESVELCNGAQIFSGIGTVNNDGSINGEPGGAGNGGTITVVVREAVTISGTSPAGFASGISSNAQIGAGSAGDIAIGAADVSISEGGRIFSDTFDRGAGGGIDIAATGSIDLSANGVSVPTISTNSGVLASGSAGEIKLNTPALSVDGGATIEAATLGIGRGGEIEITADRVALSDGGAIVAESRSGAINAGGSGRIAVFANDRIDLTRGGRVSVETLQSDAGDIDIEATNRVQLHDAASITTSVAGGDGDGGNIRIDPVFVVLDGSSRIIANARAGAGGNINIRITGGGNLFQSPDSVIEASSEFGVAGSVRIDSPDTDLISGIVALPAQFLDLSALLSDRCGPRDSEEVSSLVVTGSGAVPPGPAESTVRATGSSSCK